MRFTIDIAGDEQLSRDLLRFGKFAEDARPVFSKIADDLMKIETGQFNSQGGRGSGGWAPLAASTKAAKSRKGLDPRILHATRALRNSLTKRGAKGQNLILNDTFMVFGSTLPYMGFHQRGTSRMPQRRALELTAADRKKLVKALQRYILKGQL